MDMSWITAVYCLTHILLTWVSGATAIRCECNTMECQEAGDAECVGGRGCYTEIYNHMVTKGCDPTALACENRKPAGLDVDWPSVYCCHAGNLCNKQLVPPSPTNPEPEQSYDVIPLSPPTSNCSKGDSGQGQLVRSKVINPIYIAVPVAGVCVLLALIIFAMYLLRRRADFHHSNFHHDNLHPHHHHHPNQHLDNKHNHHNHHHNHKQHFLPQPTPTVPLTYAKSDIRAGGAHLCKCTCAKAPSVPSSCSNRCTDSERSSSGSETKLFIQS